MINAEDIKQNLGRKVLWKGEKYRLNAYVLRKKDMKIYKSVELQDNETKTVYIVPLREVEVIRNENDGTIS